MNSQTCYCRYCDIAMFNSKVTRDGIDPNSHNFKENGNIVCSYYLSNTTTKYSTPVSKKITVPPGHTLVPQKPEKFTIKPDENTIQTMRFVLDERKREADIRVSQMFSTMSENDKVRIAKWMKMNTPIGKKIGKEWEPYLATIVKSRK